MSGRIGDVDQNFCARRTPRPPISLPQSARDILGKVSASGCRDTVDQIGDFVQPGAGSEVDGLEAWAIALVAVGDERGANLDAVIRSRLVDDFQDLSLCGVDPGAHAPGRVHQDEQIGAV